MILSKGSTTNNALYDDINLEFTASNPGRNHLVLHTGINEIIISQMHFYHDVEYTLQIWELKSVHPQKYAHDSYSLAVAVVWYWSIS